MVAHAVLRSTVARAGIGVYSVLSGWSEVLGTTASRKRLEHQLGSALPSLSSDERIRVLTQVDRRPVHGRRRPLLSSLPAAGDPHFAYQYYRRVLAPLGLDAPDADEDLLDVVEADIERVFTDWRFR
ncbi:hypothetical protein [Streptomyces zagrosensis]|uniref:Uncharacterized protein n=1 Tax=Streptomyces zagrosensis TaxID=1042984 RepID=A0A7W9QH80_9ACTN|nr:hypothetical protein [Streptomyces zagrosensis]MBB5938977.1 hypothetical protein [Streptomyces zagrosensis]